jgi:hypothetical protein
MIAMSAARLACVLAILAPVVLALLPPRAAAQAQLAPVPRAPVHPGMQMARVVDDGTNLLVLPVVRLGTTERLYVRGADLAIVNSAACSLLVQAERRECLEKLPRDTAPPLRRAVSPSAD